MPQVIKKQFFYVTCVLVFLVFQTFLPKASAQNHTAGDAAEAVSSATKQGLPLTASTINVRDNVSVEAVLIPARIAKTVFGKEVANNFVVIALTITNRSSDDSLIVHSIFIDYTNWLLAGQSVFPTQSESWQATQQPNQIDSVETRIVRGQLLDRQPWTTRNWVLHALQAVGSVATAFTFTTSSQSWIRGIGAYNGQGIPAAQTFWPDATVGQMNRISDLGFQVNKVVAKQSAEIVVAFYPIDRFIPPSLRDVFISYPSAFFSNFQMLYDPKVNRQFEPFVNKVAKKCDIDNAMNHLTDILETSCENVQSLPDPVKHACETRDILSRLTLNTVRVIVSGTMTVDVNKVPPQITSVEIDTPAGKDARSMWTMKDTFTGVIWGSFLGGATPTILNVETSVIAIKRVDVGSTDSALRFTLTFSGTLPTGTNKLTFQVSKPSSEGGTIKSATYDYVTQTPQITFVQLDSPADRNLAANQPGKYTGTINGSFLGGTTPAILNLDTSVITVEPADKGSTDTALRFTLTLRGKLPEGTKELTFQVSKPSSEGATIKSAPYDYPIQTTRITSVEFDTPVDWKESKTYTGMIHGSFLGGATLTILDAETAKITVKRVEEGSTDTALRFTLSLGKQLPKDTKILTFQVSKTSPEGATIKSATYDYTIQ